MPVFFDSNLVLYLAQDDVRKAEIVEDLLYKGGWISVQVLNEVAHVCRREFRYDWRQTAKLIDGVRPLVRVIDVTISIHERGRRLAETHRLAVYDGMIVAAALEAECDTLYSEDMHAGLVVDGRLTIVNPFV